MQIKGTVTRVSEHPRAGHVVHVALEDAEQLRQIDGSHQAPGGQLRVIASSDPPDVGDPFEADIDDEALLDGSTPITIEDAAPEDDDAPEESSGEK